MQALEMESRVLEHNVAGCWIDTAGISVAATSILITVHGDNLNGDLDIVNRPTGAGYISHNDSEAGAVSFFRWK